MKALLELLVRLRGLRRALMHVLASRPRLRFAQRSYQEVPVSSSGIYAFWTRARKLVYLGVALDMRGRIRTHARVNRSLDGRWHNQISVFQEKVLGRALRRRSPGPMNQQDRELLESGQNLERIWSRLLRGYVFSWISCKHADAQDLEGLMGWK